MTSQLDTQGSPSQNCWNVVLIGNAMGGMIDEKVDHAQLTAENSNIKTDRRTLVDVLVSLLDSPRHVCEEHISKECLGINVETTFAQPEFSGRVRLGARWALRVARRELLPPVYYSISLTVTSMRTRILRNPGSIATCRSNHAAWGPRVCQRRVRGQQSCLDEPGNIICSLDTFGSRWRRYGEPGVRPQRYAFQQFLGITASRIKNQTYLYVATAKPGIRKVCGSNVCRRRAIKSFGVYGFWMKESVCVGHDSKPALSIRSNAYYRDGRESGVSRQASLIRAKDQPHELYATCDQARAKIVEGAAVGIPCLNANTAQARCKKIIEPSTKCRVLRGVQESWHQDHQYVGLVLGPNFRRGATWRGQHAW